MGAPGDPVAGANIAAAAPQSNRPLASAGNALYADSPAFFSQVRMHLTVGGVLWINRAG
jgi:hypothetical protein